MSVYQFLSIWFKRGMHILVFLVAIHYVGFTSEKLSQAIEKSMGGVIFGHYTLSKGVQ